MIEATDSQTKPLDFSTMLTLGYIALIILLVLLLNVFHVWNRNQPITGALDAIWKDLLPTVILPGILYAIARALSSRRWSRMANITYAAIATLLFLGTTGTTMKTWYGEYQTVPLYKQEMNIHVTNAAARITAKRIVSKDTFDNPTRQEMEQSVSSIQSHIEELEKLDDEWQGLATLLESDLRKKGVSEWNAKVAGKWMEQSEAWNVMGQIIEYEIRWTKLYKKLVELHMEYFGDWHRSEEGSVVTENESLRERRLIILKDMLDLRRVQKTLNERLKHANW